MSITAALGVASKIPTMDFCAGTQHEDPNKSAECLLQPKKFLFNFIFNMRVEGTHLDNKFCSHLMNMLWGLGPSNFLLRCFKFRAPSELLEACL